MTTKTVKVQSEPTATKATVVDAASPLADPPGHALPVTVEGDTVTITGSGDPPTGRTLVQGDPMPLVPGTAPADGSSATDEAQDAPVPRFQSVTAWAKEKGVELFDLAGLVVHGGWPRGSAFDKTAPLEVSEADFDKALAAFRGVTVG